MATLVAAIDARQARSGAAEFEKATKGMADSARDAQGRLVAMDKGLADVEDGTRRAARGADDLASKLKTFVTVAAVVGGLSAGVNVLARFEQGLVGVGKTTDIQGAALDELGADFIALSRDIPVTTAELLAIGQAAGQLGVSGAENILTFTETVAALGSASDLAGDEAATTLARLLNVTGEAVSEVGTLASVIVALGNNFAATESEIARTTTQVAQATAVYDIGSARAAAFGTALAALGARAELSGSAIGRTFRAIDAAVRERGEDLAELARLTGTTSEEFAAIFGADATEGVVLFLEGLGRVIDDGGDAAATLDRFGLQGEEVLKILPTLASRVDILRDALAVAAAEQENATALTIEAERAYATLGSAFTTFKNTLAAAVLEVRGSTGPLTSVVNTGSDVIAVFAGLDRAGRDVGAGATIAGVGLRVLAVAAAALAAVPLAAFFTSAAGGLASFTAFLSANPIGAVAIAVGGLAIALTGFIPEAESAADATRRFRGEIVDLTGAIDALDRARAERETLIAVGGTAAELEANARAQLRALEDVATTIAQELKANPKASIDISDLLAIAPDIPRDLIDEIIRQGQQARDRALIELEQQPERGFNLNLAIASGLESIGITTQLAGFEEAERSLQQAAAGSAAGNVNLALALELVQDRARATRDELDGLATATEGSTVADVRKSEQTEKAEDALQKLIDAQRIALDLAREGADDGGVEADIRRILASVTEDQAAAANALAEELRSLAAAQEEVAARQGATDLIGSLELELDLLGRSEDARRRLIAQQELAALATALEADEAAAFAQQLDATLAQLEIVSEAERIGQGVASAFGQAFEAVLFESASFGDALAGIFLDISRTVVQEALIAPIQEQIVAFLTSQAQQGAGQGGGGAIGAIFASLFGAADGAVFAGGRPIQGFQFGGIPSAGQAFGVQSNGQPFTLNEAGPEAILRLGRDSSGQLGVRVADRDGGAVRRRGSGGTTVINQTFTNADPGQFRNTARQGIQDARRAARVGT